MASYEMSQCRQLALLNSPVYDLPPQAVSASAFLRPRLRLAMPSPARVLPRSKSVAGSGTGVRPVVSWLSVNSLMNPPVGKSNSLRRNTGDVALKLAAWVELGPATRVAKAPDEHVLPENALPQATSVTVTLPLALKRSIPLSASPLLPWTW